MYINSHDHQTAGCVTCQEQSEDLYQTFFESSVNPLLIIDRKTTIQHANQPFFKITHTNKADVLQKTTLDKFINSNHKARLIKKIKSWVKQSNSKIFSDEICLKSPHRPKRHCLIKMTKIAHSDLIIVSIVDITERIKAENLLKESQQKFYTAFNHFPVMILILDHQQRIIEINKSARKVFFITTPSSSVIKLNQLIKDGFLPPQISDVCLSRRNHQMEDIIFTTKKNKRFHFKIIANKVKDKDGNPEWIIMIEDNTQVVKARKIIDNLPNKIIQAHEEEKRMISQEIHDTFSQSLAALKMSVQTVMSKTTTKNKSDLVAIVNQVDQLIESSRTLSQNLRPEIIDNLGLVPSLEQLAKSIHQRFDSHITIQASVKKLNLPTDLALQLYRITQEAILNAARHGQAEEIQIKLYRKKQQLKLSIIDNGKGFDQSNIDTSSKEGSHLGLKIMVERARKIHADYAIQSTVGTGTKIFLSVNLVQ